MSRPTYILAGGGTGGHLCPGLAVAEALVRRQCDALVVFACSNRPIDRTILDPLDYVVVPQPVRPLPRTPQAVPGFLKAWFASRTQSRQMLADLHPKAVLGLGGFAGGPIVHAAARKHIRAGLLNPDAVPGKANQFLSRRVDAIFCQFSQATEHFGQAADRVQQVGCPVRREVLEGDRAEAIEHFGLRPDRKTLLVFGGSTLAVSLTEAVLAIWSELDDFADRWQLLLIAGADRQKEISTSLAGRPMHAAVLPYCDRMGLAYAAADLALCRGGAATVAELDATATPAVVLPYPHHKDRQQYLNIADRVSAGSAITVDDVCDTQRNADSLRRILLPLLADESRLATMQHAASQTARTDAADRIAEWMDF